MQQKCNCEKTHVSSDLADLKDQVVSAANSLLAAVGINDTGFINVKNRWTKPTVICTKVSLASFSVSGTNRSGGIFGSPLVYPGLTRGHSRQPSSASHPRQPSSATTQVPDKPSVAIIGTSLVRGLAHRVSRQQVSATSFMYLGCELPVLRDRVPAIFSGDFNSNILVLQCAGNDLANGNLVTEVMRQLDMI